MTVTVGCCGTGGLTLEAYAKRFPLLEIQSTFYRLPKDSTAQRWRAKAGSLVFTMKAFQGVTHPADSPTWRRARDELKNINPSEVGLLRPSKFVMDSWERTIKTADLLGARVVVVQLPPSFEYSEESLERLRWLASMSKRGPTIAVEFRNSSWLPKLNEAKRQLEACEGIIVTDPLKAKPPIQTMQYYRLHGTNGFVNYRHKYTLRELIYLAERVGTVDTFVLFNNLSMKEDAKRFISLLNASHLPSAWKKNTE